MFPSFASYAGVRIKDMITRVFKVEKLPIHTLLTEEGYLNDHIYVLIEGEVSIFRKMPKPDFIIKREKKN